MNHLLGLSHRQIAEVSGWMGNYDARIRHEIFLDILQRARLEPSQSVESDLPTPGGYIATGQLLDHGAPFTALICGNDETSLGALRYLHERGVRVPEDVSVTGFDDNVEVAYYEPPLTTVRQDLEAQARQSIRYPVTLVEQLDTPRYQQLIYPQIVIRQSTRRIG